MSYLESATRRGFLGTLAGAGSLLAAPAKKKILILGGTGFLGPATVEAAQKRGHELTLFNRGKTRPGLFPNIEQLHGDRDPEKGEGLKALAGRKWDVVIDNSAYFPRQVTASAKLLAPNVGQYIIISSISAYVDNSKEGQDERAKLATMPDPTVEKITDGSYGPLKVLCEQAAEAALPGRTMVVRPGYIVGPDDPSGRFTYWPVRFDQGGEVLVPGSAGDPLQIIDVRDLGTWLIVAAEKGLAGAFNTAGPVLKWGDVVESCRKHATKPSTPAWVPAEWVAKNAAEVFPIWAPYQGETKGFHTWSSARAVKAGLVYRPYSETVGDTLRWYKTQEEGGRTKLAGPKPEKEAELLAAYRKSVKG